MESGSPGSRASQTDHSCLWESPGREWAITRLGGLQGNKGSIMATLGPAVGRVRLGPNRPLLTLRNTRVLWEGTMQKGIITLRLWGQRPEPPSHPGTPQSRAWLGLSIHWPSADGSQKRSWEENWLRYSLCALLAVSVCLCSAELLTQDPTCSRQSLYHRATSQLI